MPSRDKLRLQIPIIADGLVWMAVLGNIQLGLRHPQNRGPSANVARQFAEQLLEKLKKEGVLTDDEAAFIWLDEMKARN